MSVGSWFAKGVWLPATDLSKRSPFARIFEEALRNERLSLAELEELQALKVRRVLTHAMVDVSYYRGQRPKSLRLEDWPLLGKGELMSHHDELLATGHPGKRMNCTTSGSTGTATRFAMDSVHWAWVEACVWRGRRWWGVERGDREVVLWSRPVDNTWATSQLSNLKYRLRNVVEFDTFREFTEGRVAEIGEALNRWRPEHIYGYGSSLGALASGLERQGWERGGWVPKQVEYTADHMFEGEKIAAERVFGAQVCSGYGSSEVGGVAQECREGRLHISVDQAVVEVLGPNQEVLGAGEVGELVLTTLNNRAMPLVRYRVGDLGKVDGVPCPCGHPFPTMTLQSGKAIELISTSSRSNVSAHVLDYINLFVIREKLVGIRQFQVVQEDMDTFTLKMVVEAVVDPRAPEVFVAKMREYLGKEIAVKVETVDAIPLLPSGKRRYFIRRQEA